MACEEGIVLFAADSTTESPTSSDRLMESICDPENLNTAMAKVIANGGAPGVDGMRVTQLEKYFERHRDRIVGELLAGTYRPQPVKRVEIPKPDGGVRKLGIPTAVDRVIQQAILLVAFLLESPRRRRRSSLPSSRTLGSVSTAVYLGPDEPRGSSVRRD